MMAKKKTVTPKKNSNKTYSIQRGGEEFKVVEADGAFAVRRKKPNSTGTLIAIAQSPGRFPGLQVDDDRSPRGVELYYVEPTARDSAMQELRTNSPDVAWCSHVFHTPSDTDSILFPLDSIYVELSPSATNSELNDLLDQYGLEYTPDPHGDPSCCILTLTSESKENPFKIANALRQSSVIALAEPDLAVRGKLALYRPADDLFPLQWHLENRGGFAQTAGADVSAPKAWDLTRGSRRITIAVIDDGFDLDHPDFASPGKIRAPQDFGDGDTDPSPVSRADNHGTACAGVAIADENGSGVVGVAPECGLMPIRWSGTVSDSDIRDQFAHPEVNGADVISCSWGVSSSFFTLSTSMKRSIRNAATQGRNGKGCIIVFAAGNDDQDIDDPPRTRDGFAIHPDVIAVAACNSRDQRSHYSNFGDAIWIAAPSSGRGGVGIVTTDRRGSVGYQSGDYTTVQRFGGTSSATPLVAGICGLMLSVNPELTVNDVKEILRETAEKIDPQSANYDSNGHSRLYGYGRVDAFRAVQAARDRRQSPGSTIVRFSSNPNLTIPDNQPVGVADVIVVNHDTAVEFVEVECRIDHTYRGDLSVNLISPRGKKVQLFGRTGPARDSADNLIAHFTSTNVPGLDSLFGENAKGNWTLQVADLAAFDTGQFRDWTLVLGLSTQRNQWMVAPGVPIPDNNATGITSELQVDTGGVLRDIKVNVDITHTYRGDLSIILECPSGERVTLRSTDTGDSSDNLQESSTPTDTPALRSLIENRHEIRGTWKLHVMDNLSADVGKLNAWGLELTV